MTDHDDNRLVEYLYGEMPEGEAHRFEQALAQDAPMRSEVEDVSALLGTIRQIEDEEPSAHLDSLILATARQQVEDRPSPWFRKLFSGPIAGLLAAGACAVFLAAVALPYMSASDQSEPLAASSPAAAPNEVPPPAQKGFASADRAAALEPSKDVRAEPPAFEAEEVRSDRREAEVTLAGGKVGTTGAGQGGGGRGSGIGSGVGAIGSQPRSAAGEASARPLAKKANVEITDRATAKAKRPAATPRAEADEDGIATLVGSASGEDSAGFADDEFAGPADSPVADPSPAGPSPTAAAAPSVVSPPKPSPRLASPAPPPATRRSKASNGMDAMGGYAVERKRDATDEDVEARAFARRVHAKARAAIARRDMQSARKLYLDGRKQVKGTLAYFELSLWLARLEYEQGQYELASRYGAEAMESRDAQVRNQARAVVARARHGDEPAAAGASDTR